MLPARILAILATLLLAAVAIVVATQSEHVGRGGESAIPYAAVTVFWLLVYLVVDMWAARKAKAAHRRSARNFFRLSAAAVACWACWLAVLSLALTTRYAFTPATWRRAERELTIERIECLEIQPPLGEYATAYAYSKPRPDLPRVIFIHGTPGSAMVMSNYTLDPIDGFECIAVDRPGFGKAFESSPHSASFEAQAAVIANLLVERSGRKPIVVGHSIGGPIAARIAADYPDRVGGLVILAGSIDPGLEESRWYNTVTSMEPASSKMPSAYQVANREIERAPEETKKLAAVLDRITCPVRVIHGDADKLVPVGNVKFITEAMKSSPSVEVIVVPGEGHGVHTKCEKLVRETISKLGGREPQAPASK